MPSSHKHYKAFISYSHKDAKWAKWLHRSLEHYVVPIDAFPPEERLEADGSKRSRRLTPVFRDREEMPASGSLGAAIQGALESSENLIVLCSPNSAGSQYVNAEIDIFRNLHPDNKKKIYALIIEGEPSECFPPALIAEGAEPIAADAREEGDGKSDSKLKLIAGMLGVGFDRLKRREAKRLRNRMLATIAVVSAIAILTSVSTLWVLKAQQDTKEALSREENARLGEIIQKKRAEQSASDAIDARKLAEQSASDAIDARKLAEQSAKESISVMNFYAKILKAARPKEVGGLGVDVTVRKSIDAVSYQIKASFPEQPVIEASVRHALSETYNTLGDYEAAISQLELAVGLRELFLGVEDRNTLISMSLLASTYGKANRLDEALSLHERVLGIRINALELEKKEFGEHDPSAFYSMIDVADSYRALGRHNEEIQMLEKAMKSIKKEPKVERDFTSLFLTDYLSKSYRMLDLDGKAQEWSGNLPFRSPGENYNHILNAIRDLSLQYEKSSRLDEAKGLKKEKLELRSKLKEKAPK